LFVAVAYAFYYSSFPSPHRGCPTLSGEAHLWFFSFARKGGLMKYPHDEAGLTRFARSRLKFSQQQGFLTALDIS
jgi:hypothetical protein